MKTLIKKLLNAAAISIAVCTVLSTVLYAWLGRGSVRLINPFGMNYAITISDTGKANYNDVPIFVESLIIYALFGMACAFIPWVFKNEKLSLFKATLINFIATFSAFFVMILASSAPWGLPASEFWSTYTQLGVFMTKQFVLPQSALIIVGYVFIWLGAFFYYRKQAKKLNAKINERS